MTSYQMLIVFPLGFNTDGRSVLSTRGTRLKNKTDLVTFHERILVSKLTFLLTLVYYNIYIYIKL